MQVPLTISFHGVDKSPYVEDLIRDRAARLEDLCDHVNSCRVAVERPHAHPSSGSSWRVRIDLRVAPGHELIVDRAEMDGDVNEDLYDAVNDAFEKMKRQLRRLAEKQNGDVKTHPQQQLAGVVEKLFEDYGFIRGADGREIYFHENSTLDRFEDMEIGMGVAYEEEPGEEGPQATTVRVVDGRRGHRTSAEPPLTP